MGTFLCQALKVFLLLQPWPYGPVEEDPSLSLPLPFFFSQMNLILFGRLYPS